ncbi:hypothetical protein M0804_008021 [Polistes exclamans]|nr:hypothetical protein M0804_008021 [Polistes exclamans]
MLKSSLSEKSTAFVSNHQEEEKLTNGYCVTSVFCLSKDRVILERVLRRLCINVCPDICKQALPVSPCRDVTIHYPLAAGLNVSRPQGLRTSFGKVTVPTVFALCCWCFLKGKEKFDGQWFLARTRDYPERLPK